MTIFHASSAESRKVPIFQIFGRSRTNHQLMFLIDWPTAETAFYRCDGPCLFVVASVSCVHSCSLLHEQSLHGWTGRIVLCLSICGVFCTSTSLLASVVLRAHCDIQWHVQRIILHCKGLGDRHCERKEGGIQRC